MASRVALSALVIVEALLWLAATNSPLTRMYWLTLAGRPYPLGVILSALACALAFVIGLLCRKWRGAIALPALVGLLALIFVILTSGVSPASGMLYVVAPPVALGWLGWLARSLRAEFAA